MHLLNIANIGNKRMSNMLCMNIEYEAEYEVIECKRALSNLNMKLLGISGRDNDRRIFCDQLSCDWAVR